MQFYIRNTAIAFFICSAFQSYSQTLKVTERIGGIDQDYTSSLHSDNEDNAIAGGFFYSTSVKIGPQVFPNKGAADIFLCKYNANRLIWALTFGSNGDDFLQGICTDSYGNIYISGTYAGENFTLGTKKLPATNQNNIFIAKIDKNGNPVWLKSITGNKSDINRAITIHNNKLYITGGLRSDTAIYGADTFIKKTDIAYYNAVSALYIIQLDLDGNLLNAKFFGAPGIDAKGFDISIKDGYIYCTGNFYGDFILGKDTLKHIGPSDYDFWIGKFDLDGKPIWAKSIGGQRYDAGTKLYVDDNDDVRAVAITFSNWIKLGNDTIKKEGSTHHILLKYNTNGKLLGYKPIWDSLGQAVATLDNSGTLFLSGLINQNKITIGADTIYKSPWPDIVSIRFDGLGNITETTEFPVYSKTNLPGVSKTAVGLWMAGSFTDYKLNIAGTLLQNVGKQDAFVAYFEWKNLSVTENDVATFTLYPNPTTGILHVKASLPIKAIYIYNLQGIEILYQPISDKQETTLNLSMLKTGMYYAQVLTNSGINTAKVMVY